MEVESLWMGLGLWGVSCEGDVGETGLETV